MSRMKGSVLLVGSIPGDDAEQAMRICGADLGERLSCLPDGETGQRRIWINYLASNTYDGTPGLVTLNQPKPVDPDDPEEWRASGEDWAPQGYTDHWQFKVKDGVGSVAFDALGYASVAIDSYATFCRLREAGTISPGVRFMVALPLAESAVRPFVTNADDFALIKAAYERALAGEIETMLDHIPPSDLCIQYDVCMEVIAIELNDERPGLFDWAPPGDPFERYCEMVAAAANLVPDDVLLGLHLCYGDLGHRHVIEPQDLGVVVRMANAAKQVIARPVDFYHMPVPKERHDDRYFEPLKELEASQAKLYLGLIHVTGGVEAARKRLASARRHASGFGVATECGFGRRPIETIPALLEIHRAIADALPV